MKKQQGKTTILIRIVFLWIVDRILFFSAASLPDDSIKQAYQRALNDYRNKKIDEKNAEMTKKGINIRNLNKKL
ncbi:hypothetical protein AB7038_09970 [Morganella morganii]|uniref:hypothetical protein n=1 Tax=Morganella morganii TaxID=582 RepID=UPI0034E50591